MAKINCNVTNCAHNNSSVCYSNIVNIKGGKATDSCSTCCGNFLDERDYSTLTNNTNGPGPCDALVCSVQTCVYNKNQACSAESINVNGNDVAVYTEANCSTFKHQ